MTDQQLLTRYADHHDQQAFAELVRRHVDWINSMALRLVHDPALAADVTQAVFVVLARKASSLRHQQVLFPWLFSVARFAGCKTFRDEMRRRKHERKAAAMRQETVEALKEPSWEELSPLLDELVDRLRTNDRQVVLLRFYGQKSFAEIGEAMEISEVAARKRVARAVDQLRDLFARRGVTIGAAALATTITANLTHPASAAVLASATAASASGASTALVNAANAMLTWASLKPVAAIIAFVLMCSAVATVAVLQTAPAQQAAAAPPSTMPATAPAIASSTRFGRILTQEGKPIAGARIWQLRNADAAPDQIIVGSTTSDAAGRFQLPQPGEDARVMVRAAGYGWSTEFVRSRFQDDPDEVLLEAPTKLRVRFVDSEDKAMAGLHVRLMSVVTAGRRGTLDFPSEFNEADLTQTTDAEGACVFADLPQDGEALLAVTDDQFAQLTDADRIELSNSATTEAGPLHLQRAAGISGKVTADDGKPIAGIRVRAMSDSNFSAEARTDASGRYNLKQLLAGKYIIGLSLTEEFSRRYAAVDLENIRVAPGMNRSDQDFSLISGGIVQGRVTEQATGKPLKGMHISVSVGHWSPPPRPNTASVVTSDADGFYSAHTAPGEQQYAYFTSVPPPWLKQPSPLSQELHVAEHDTAEANFALPISTTTTIHGRAVTPDGHPLANAEIYLQQEGSYPPGALSTVTNAVGDFSVLLGEHKPQMQPFLILRGRKGNWTTIEPVAPSGQDVTLVLHQNAQASIRVLVQQVDGKPLPGAAVMLTETGYTNGRIYNVRTTGADGICVFRRLDPDQGYGIAVSAKGFDHIEQMKVRVQPGKQTDFRPIILAKADSVIAGMVVDENGNPMPEVRVMLQNPIPHGMPDGVHNLHQESHTNALGQFRFENVLPGVQSLIMVLSDDQPPHQLFGRAQNIAPGTQDLVIVLHPSQLAPSTRPVN